MTKQRPSRFRQIIYNYLSQVRWSLFFGVLCMFGLTLTDLLRPWPIKIIFDHIESMKPYAEWLGD